MGSSADALQPCCAMLARHAQPGCLHRNATGSFKGSNDGRRSADQEETLICSISQARQDAQCLGQLRDAAKVLLVPRASNIPREPVGDSMQHIPGQNPRSRPNAWCERDAAAAVLPACSWNFSSTSAGWSLRAPHDKLNIELYTMSSKGCEAHLVEITVPWRYTLCVMGVL